MYLKLRKTKKLKIFGKIFVTKNKFKVKLEIKGKEYELIEFFQDNSDAPLEIKIKGINNIDNASCMFEGCKCLISLQGFLKWNISNIRSKSRMFSGYFMP